MVKNMRKYSLPIEYPKGHPLTSYHTKSSQTINEQIIQSEALNWNSPDGKNRGENLNNFFRSKNLEHETLPTLECTIRISSTVM